MKPYSWEEIKSVLKKELRKTKNIMTFGTIGSCNVEHDVDVMITKKPNSKTSDFYKEIHSLYEKLNKFLRKKYGAKLIQFALLEPEILKLSKYSGNDLALHTLIYTSYPQLESDWSWALSEGENINSILKDNYSCIFGSNSNLFEKSFNKKGRFDNVYLFLYWYDKIHSRYPENFLVEVMNYYFDFLYRKKLGLKTPHAKNVKEVKKHFYRLCDILDKMNNTNFNNQKNNLNCESNHN